ncbi:hypothetical protein HDU78_011385 [Chytriomyces hyalinus]|nr:hypothetical protein HDU78_011385 [Chytriomyces hyalinus]
MDPKPEPTTAHPTRISTNDSSVRVAVRIRPTSTTDACFTSSKTAYSVSAPDASCSFIVPNSEQSIRVLCPSNASTLFATSTDVTAASSSAVVAAAADVDWEYDSVWAEDSNQESIFESEVAPLVSAFIEGFNTTLFAYGQTGSGKTFTMGTAITDPTPRRSATPSKLKDTRVANASGRSTPTSKPSTPSKPRPSSSVSLVRPAKSTISPSDSAVSFHDLTASSGMIPRAVHAIFNKLETLRASEPSTTHNETLKSYSVSVSFLELHNEEWVDLLKESKGANTAKKPPTPNVFKSKASVAEEVSIREDKEGRIAIHGATTVIVESAEAAIRLLSKGSKLRSTAATSMNESSSRSHAIFSLSLTSTQMTRSVKSPVKSQSRSAEPQRSNTGLVITSKFHFVDLAGSERLKRTQNTGDRKTEGICINQGLLVLGRVINCLSESKPNNPDAVVPYRDSKLTRFLQDSLGGNSKTVMLACVSSLESDLSESINTLRYASRARGIQNKSRITIDSSGANSEVVPLLAEIALLKSLLAEANLVHAADEMAIVSLQSDLDAAVAGSAAEEKMRNLEIENAQLVKRVQEAESGLLESKEMIKDLEKQWKLEQVEARHENDALLVQLSAIRNCRGDVLDLEMEVDSLKNKLKAAQDYASLVEDTLSTQTAKDALNLLQVSELRMEIDSLGSCRQTLLDRVARAEEGWAAATATATDLRTQQHQEIEQLTHESQQKSIEIENLTKQVMQEKCAHEQAKRSFNEQTATLMEKLEMIQQDKTALHQTITHLETNLKETESRNATLSTQLFHQTKAAETATLETVELTQKMQNQESVSHCLRLKLLDSEGRTSHLEAEVVELHRILEIQSTELQKTIAEKHALSDLMRSLKSEMERDNFKSSELIHETAEALIQKNSQLAQELESERSKFQLEKDNASNLKSRVDQLTQEIQSLQMHLMVKNEPDHPTVLEPERAAPAAEGHDFTPTPQPNLPSPHKPIPLEMRKSMSSASLVQRRIAEYSQLKTRGELFTGDPKLLRKGASSDDLHDSELIERYQFLLKTVQTVKELFEP